MVSCLCGDPSCPSCGPAQGFCPICSEEGKEECECNDYDEYDIFDDEELAFDEDD